MSHPRPMSQPSLVSAGARARARELAVPVAMALGRLGLTPNGLTAIGFLGTVVAAVAAAAQQWPLAGVLILVFGVFDLFDGTLARATGRASALGAFLDSTLDRAGEAIVYVGILVGALAGGFDAMAGLAAAAMAAAFMVSYTRAKSEGLGFTPGTGMASVGIAPREIRIVILSAGLIVGGLVGVVPADLTSGSLVIEGALALIAVLAVLTTIQRIVHVINQSHGQNPPR
jgi:CDP-diacylglycerol--glycerol-3-phosphate 3-phosphatidyltransferase